MKQIVKSFLSVILLAGIFQACSKSSGGGTTSTLVSTDSVTTIAGNGVAGTVDGNSATAEFNGPNGVALDNAGNIYVGDHLSNVIRKITSSGLVSTIAGNGIAGYADGPAATAEFNSPQGVAVDAQGNIYVPDAGNHRIRMITPAGLVSTIAGNGIAGYADGPAATAEFHNPNRVILDPQGNIYVADLQNNLVRKITPAGIVSTVAGNGTPGWVDGPAASAEFNWPDGLYIDGQNNIYVADYHNQRIRRISAAGIVSTVAGNGTLGFVDGNAATAEFNGPSGVVLDAQGNIYVSDQEGNRIREITTAGIVSTIAGNGASGHVDGNALSAEFNNPRTLAMDVQGNLYTADYDNNVIRKITLK